MGVIYLSVELFFDLLTLLLGLILVFCARDNSPKFYWGIISVMIGAMFSWENIEWLSVVSHNPDYRYVDVLNMEKMLKWYPTASVVALFPLASLAPGYLNPFRVLLFLLPSLLLTTVGVSYLFFNGVMTPLSAVGDVFVYIENPDVALRCFIFLMSVLTPLAVFIFPILFHAGVRRPNRMMYIFIGFMMLFVFIYVLFTLDISYFIFNLFGATAIIFSLFFSVQYLLKENPFAHFAPVTPFYPEPLPVPDKKEPPVIQTRVHPLFRDIESFLLQDHVYTRPDFTISNLADTLRIRENYLSDAIKSAGFSSFREYMNYLRMEYFKNLVCATPEKSIKELIYLCGFNSRATFYRNFSERYGISPSMFVEKNKKNMQ